MRSTDTQLVSRDLPNHEDRVTNWAEHEVKATCTAIAIPAVLPVRQSVPTNAAMFLSRDHRSRSVEAVGAPKRLQLRRAWRIEEVGASKKPLERLRSWSIGVREAETRGKDRADQIQRVFRSGHQVRHRMVSPRTVRNLDAF